MSVPRYVALTEAFYEWERRGRGWERFPFPVALEPHLVWPDFHRSSAASTFDDTRRETWASKLFSKKSEAGTEPVHETPYLEPPEEASTLEYDSVAIFCPESLDIAPAIAVSWLASLETCQHPMAWEVVGVQGQVTQHLATTSEDMDLAVGALRAVAPDAVIRSDEETLEDLWVDAEERFITGVEFGLGSEFMLPIANFLKLPTDPLAPIAAALGGTDGVALLQILFSHVDANWKDATLRAVTTPAGQPFFADAPDLTKRAFDKVSSPLVAATVRLVASASTEDLAWDVVRGVAGGLAQLTSSQGNDLIPVGIESPTALLEDALLRQSHRHGMILSLGELAGLVHLPNASVRVPALIRLTDVTKEAPESVRSGGVFLGINEHHGLEAEVRLATRDRMRHCHVVGASGTGKSTLLVSMMLDDIEKGHGVAVLDPHGDLVDEVLTRLPESRLGDVVLFDPSDPEYVVGWNVLGAHTELEKELMASDLTATFARLSTSWGDQMSTVLSNAVLAFLNSSRGGTLQDLRQFLVEGKFREAFLKTVTDEYISEYWNQDFKLIEKRNPQAPILTRLNTFLRNKLVRDVVTLKEKHVDFREVMDKKRIFLARLSQGAIGEENASLLGNLLVSKIHQVTLSRQDVAREEREPYFLYLDEFHEMATASMATMFSGVRKYGLSLTVAHQDLYQLRQTLPQVERAVLSNSHTRICFRVGDDDAKKLTDGFSEFDAKSLTDLGIGQAIARVGRRTDDFNLKTFDLPKVDRETASETLRERRRAVLERWGVQRQQADKQAPKDDLKAPKEDSRVQQKLGQSVEEKRAPVEAVEEPAAAGDASTQKIDKATLDYLEHVAQEPFLPVRERNEALDLSAWKGQAIKSEIVGAGYAKEISINPGGRGQQFKLLELATAGRELLDDYGIALPTGYGRGGLAHQWWVNEIAEWLESLGIEASIEDEESGARVDLAFAHRGKRVAVEVETSEGHEVENLKKDLATSSFEFVVSLVSVESSIPRLQKRIDGELSAARSVRIVPLQDFKEALAPHVSSRPSALGRQNQNKETRRTRRQRPSSRATEAPVPSEVFFPEQGVMTTPIAAQYLGLSPATLETLRSRGGGPTFVKLGRRVVYRKEDLDMWLDARRQKSTSETLNDQRR